ncbi:MAG: hypothetical protein COA99_11965, partial [Moraxellaceae bacterium]
MDNSLYDIYFRGGIAPGQDMDTVKANLARLFKADDAKITAMFSGRAIVLKKDLEKDTALKYQAAMENAGAKVILREKAALATASASAPAAVPSSSPSSNPSSNKAPTQPQEPVSEQDGSWDIAPVGSDVLTDAERQPVTQADIDTSAFTLAPPSPMPTLNTTEPPPPPNTDHISVAEA